MKIEPLLQSDLGEILEMAKKAHTESFYRDFPFDTEGAALLILNSCSNDDYFGVKCVKDDKIIGYCGGMLSKMPFSTQMVGVDNGFYLEPEYRGTRAFALMIAPFFEWCAKKMVMPFFVIHYGEENDKTYKACEKMGMVERGRIFIGAENVRKCYH